MSVEARERLIIEKMATRLEWGGVGETSRMPTADEKEQAKALRTILATLADAEREPDWAVSKDGPYSISDNRRWLARKLMDSKLTEKEALSIVAFAPDIKNLITAPPPPMQDQEARREHRFGSPPEPVVNPSEAWCDAYAGWYYQGRG